MEPITGCGGWIQYADAFAGKSDEIADLGLDYVLMKVIDGRNMRNTGTALRGLGAKLAKRNIRVFGWGYIYPGSAAEAGRLAAERCGALEMEYFSVDFEIEFEKLPQKDSVAAAKAFLAAFTSAAPGIGLLGSSFYLPSKHRGVPYQTFLTRCQYWQPQCYWENHPVRFTIDHALAEGAVFGKPMIATLPSYDMRGEGGVLPARADLATAAQEAMARGAKAVDFFTLDEAHPIPALWAGIKDAAKVVKR